MSTDASTVGVIGLGVMGENLARNLAGRGWRVVGYDRDPDDARRLAREHAEKIASAASVRELVEKLERPRHILVMVPAGPPVDDVLDALDPLLDRDDIVVDGGNSHFRDTDRRSQRAASRAWRLVGMGVSGGAEGALHGPSLMPGGDPDAWKELRPILESIAARSDAGPCAGWCGPGSAGHFVKMVHNGIEYAEMQQIAEAVTLLRRGLARPPEEVAGLFAHWNQGELESFLVEITADILRQPDPRDPDALLVDRVLDRAEQKGTGRWTVAAALDLGVAVPSIAAAVDARVLSSDPETRRRGEAALGELRRPGSADLSPDDVQAALLGARIASYSQGFVLLAAASREWGYGTDLAEVARIWKAGCIIRARLLDEVRQAAAEEDGPLALAPTFVRTLREVLPAWRRVVSALAEAGLPAPALSAGLAWLDTLATERGNASLIQAQRDYFGGHGYERVDDPGNAVHTDWSAER